MDLRDASWRRAATWLAGEAYAELIVAEATKLGVERQTTLERP